MATNDTLLASEIAAALGHPGDVTLPVQGFAEGILDELTSNGIAGFGGIPGPHPISGMTGASMASKVAAAAGYPGVSPELMSYCSGIVLHIQTAGQVFYTGPIPPPPPGFELDGTITGLNGAAMAALIVGMVPYPGATSELIDKCTAIADHIMTNAEVVSGAIS